MIVSGYTMHLYCENEQTNHTSWEDENGRAEYVGETWGECAKQARRDGWKLKRHEGEAYCPRCSGKVKK